MSLSLVRSSISSVAAAAATATCATIGVTYLLFDNAGAPLPLVTIPACALLLTGALIAETERRRGGTSAAGLASAARPIAVAPATLDAAFAERFLAAEFAAAQRGRQIAVVIFQIDNFARAGTLYDGSADGLLLSVSHVMRRCTRAMNLSARDEARPGTFISILSDADAKGATRFVQRVRRELAALKAGGSPISLSAGVATFDFAMRDARDLRRTAERAADRAARDGGNRVVVISSNARS